MALTAKTRAAIEARTAHRRMAAAVRRGSLNASILKRWLANIDSYRRRGDWLSILDFMHEYGAGIDAFCRPTSFDRRAA